MYKETALQTLPIGTKFKLENEEGIHEIERFDTSGTGIIMCTCKVHNSITQYKTFACMGKFNIEIINLINIEITEASVKMLYSENLTSAEFSKAIARLNESAISELEKLIESEKKS